MNQSSVSRTAYLPLKMMRVECRFWILPVTLTLNLISLMGIMSSLSNLGSHLMVRANIKHHYEWWVMPSIRNLETKQGNLEQVKNEIIRKYLCSKEGVIALTLKHLSQSQYWTKSMSFYYYCSRIKSLVRKTLPESKTWTNTSKNIWKSSNDQLQQWQIQIPYRQSQ